MERRDDMIIHFSGLKSGVYTYDFVLDDDFFLPFENEEIVGGNIIMHAEMERKERFLMFQFHFSGSIKTWCNRCLEDLTIPLSGDESLCVRFSDEEQSDEVDLIILPEKAHEIDLSQYLYEIVAVRIPARNVHEEGGCNEQTIAYLVKEDDDFPRAVESSDSRWDVLRDILKAYPD